jgi:hypothetical protein
MTKWNKKKVIVEENLDIMGDSIGNNFLGETFSGSVFS